VALALDRKDMKQIWSVAAWSLACTALLAALHWPLQGTLRAGPLLDPWHGLYQTARMAEHPKRFVQRIPGVEAPVTVERDARGVPHIFAQNDWDALTALGYVTAQDRLFQMDFSSRVVAGRLAEIFGPSSIEADRFLRGTGMEKAAQQIALRMHEEGALELQIVEAYARGVNAYIQGLTEATLPFEFRLFDHWPEPYTALHAARMVQFFNYDLTYETDDSAYGILQARLGGDDYAALYPRHAPLYVPIIQGDEASPQSFGLPAPTPGGVQVTRPHLPMAEGFSVGKGSNSWAVFGARSATGAPILAGDMHLTQTMPNIWYEAHLVTPTMNLYGVLSPGTPLVVEGFNDNVGWVFTNLGADAVDFYQLELDDTGRRYRFDGVWRDLLAQIDTIRVRGAVPVVDTRVHTHFGPVFEAESGALAMRWVAYEPNNTLTALWGLAHAQSVSQIELALMSWGAPAQNVLFADGAGQVAYRAAGFVPRSADGSSRAGVLDGTTSATQWQGPLPFAAMPAAKNPERGYFATSNQQPTTAAYPHYLGHNWPSAYRSLRLDALLSGKPVHSLEDMMAYQRDVHVMQHELLMPHLEALTLLPPPAARLRDRLTAWDGKAETDRSEPLALYTFMEVLQNLAWDEAVFAGLPRPRSSTLLALLEEGSPFFDVMATDGLVEDAAGLLRMALMATQDTLVARHGADPAAWEWGVHHKLVARHLTQSPALSALWSKPYAYPGFEQTVSPGGNLTVDVTASWRMIVDFSMEAPRGYGVYFGGQSGNPFSSLYDAHMDTYVAFEYYALTKPTAPNQIDAYSALLIMP